MALKARSRFSLTVVSIEVRFLRRRDTASLPTRLPRLVPWPPRPVGLLGLLLMLIWAAAAADEWLLCEASASSNHLANRGFSLHMFLNDRLRASNLEMVVWEKSLPYILPIAS